jgi:alkylation response protein AidB-like acyl-CoA dehydrogenase
LRQSGLLALSIAPSLGGHGAGSPDVLSVVRLFARADASLAHLFGFQHLMLATSRLFGHRSQWERLHRDTAEKRWFWGNALNPLDTRTRIVPERDGFVLNGTKSFCSGSVDSDQLIVSALGPTEKLVVLAVPTARPGVRVLGDWNNMGQRQTDSGTVELHDVHVTSDEILATPGPLGSTFASLRPLLAQLILSNVYLGIAEGALEVAKGYTREARRAWITSGVETPSHDPYILRHYGDLLVSLEAARALSDRAAQSFELAWESDEALEAETRGRVATEVALAKVTTTRTALSVTERMFEVMGARATSAQLNLDRFWRNARTHTLHDPVDYKLRELGDFALNDRLPTPSFYS